MTLQEKLETIGGCSDGNCLVHVRGGMHTNGGCRCLYRDASKSQQVVMAYKEEVERLRGALKEIVLDCEAEYPPSHGAIKYACKMALGDIHD